VLPGVHKPATSRVGRLNDAQEVRLVGNRSDDFRHVVLWDCRDHLLGEDRTVTFGSCLHEGSCGNQAVVLADEGYVALILTITLVRISPVGSYLACPVVAYDDIVVVHSLGLTLPDLSQGERKLVGTAFHVLD